MLVSVRMFWEMTNSIVVMWDRDPNQTLIVKVFETIYFDSCIIDTKYNISLEFCIISGCHNL